MIELYPVFKQWGALMMNTTPQRLVVRLSTVAIALSLAVGLNSCTSNVQSQQPQPINLLRKQPKFK
ncbi:hypothetical protein [Coleofasciculus chthonoplastes]|uniref:hypothetical protein n=2 Tax=Coleofasciculaceae TaxID=1892251 RepID=UPI0032FB61A5